MAQYTEYHPLKFWLDPASIAEIVAHIQTYLVSNPINSTTEIETIIHDYLIAHPELIGGVDSVNGQTGEVVLTADNISGGENVTIADVLDSLQDQIDDIVASIPSDYQQLIDDVSDLKSALNYDSDFQENSGEIHWKFWEQGNISSSGDNVYSAYYVRSNGYIPTYVDTASLSDTDAQSFRIKLVAYTENGVYVANTGFSSTLAVSQFLVSHPTAKRVRIICHRTDDAAVTPETACAVTFSYDPYIRETAFNTLSEQVEENSTNITANAERIAELFPTVVSQPYLTELYLKNVDTTKSIATTRIALNVFSSGVYTTIINLAYTDSSTVIARFFVQSADKYVPLKNQIVEIVERNGSGVYGYAVIDFTTMDDGDDVRTNYNINMERVSVRAYNPIINNYLGNNEDVTGIVYLNKESEIYLYQAYMGRSNHFADTYEPLRFIHFSDVHRSPSQWERLCEYVDKYEDYIQFAIHTGDYVGSNQGSYDNHYASAKPTNRYIYNVVGNHDSYASGSTVAGSASQADTYQILFGDADVSEWGATFGTAENAMYYYKDFADSGIRLIVIDQYYWNETEASWLDSVLADAITQGLWVITAMHTITGELTNIGSTFFTKDNWSTEAGGINASIVEGKIASFVSSGGTHICHLSGHYHHDKIGVTSNGLLEIMIECDMRPNTGSVYSEWDDSARVWGNKSWDSFNYMSINRNLGQLKIVRIGCDSDHYLQSKKVLCYDFINRQIVSNF